LLPTLFCMKSCDFVNEEFPAEIQKFAKGQQVLNYARYSNFLYKVLATVIFLIPFFLLFPKYFSTFNFRNTIFYSLNSLII
jgi:hypothetical protein